MAEKIDTVKFKCPNCKDERLECVMDGHHLCPVLNISVDGDFEYGPYESRADVARWQCVCCGCTLKDKDGNTITDNLDVVEWIKENCEQE